MAFSTIFGQDDEAKWKCKCTLGYEGDPKIPALEKGSIEGAAPQWRFDGIFLLCWYEHVVWIDLSGSQLLW